MFAFVTENVTKNVTKMYLKKEENSSHRSLKSDCSKKIRTDLRTVCGK